MVTAVNSQKAANRCVWNTTAYECYVSYEVGEAIDDEQEEPAESDLCDRPRSGRPSSAHSSGNIDQADTLIKENRRITINELAESLGVSGGNKDHGYPGVFKSMCQVGPKAAHRGS